jgi:hypothetical protein
MNKKLRLLVTTKCPNKCPMCCNNSWDFSSLPVVDRWNYEEIMITGGEPQLFYDRVIELAKAVRVIGGLSTSVPKVYVYTSIAAWDMVRNILCYIDGIVLTPHSQIEIERFVELNKLMLELKGTKADFTEGKSLRLNLFADMKSLLPKHIDLSLWQVKDMEWLDNCPVPKGEDFRRIKELW